mmetsp:Transcript_36473/g.95507  ORF Transcript_36473/g.95507 Transcript_36473/m.95507 type:complete len:200 (-) Transcript_36473:1740-2339(-)
MVTVSCCASFAWMQERSQTRHPASETRLPLALQTRFEAWHWPPPFPLSVCRSQPLKKSVPRSFQLIGSLRRWQPGRPLGVLVQAFHAHLQRLIIRHLRTCACCLTYVLGTRTALPQAVARTSAHSIEHTRKHSAELLPLLPPCSLAVRREQQRAHRRFVLRTCWLKLFGSTCAPCLPGAFALAAHARRCAHELQTRLRP